MPPARFELAIPASQTPQYYAAGSGKCDINIYLGGICGKAAATNLTVFRGDLLVGGGIGAKPRNSLWVYRHPPHTSQHMEPLEKDFLLHVFIQPSFCYFLLHVFIQPSFLLFISCFHFIPSSLPYFFFIISFISHRHSTIRLSHSPHSQHLR